MPILHVFNGNFLASLDQFPAKIICSAIWVGWVLNARTSFLSCEENIQALSETCSCCMTQIDLACKCLIYYVPSDLATIRGPDTRSKRWMITWQQLLQSEQVGS